MYTIYNTRSYPGNYTEKAIFEYYVRIAIIVVESSKRRNSMKNYLSQKQHIYNFISDEISNGKLNRNDKLTEQYIAEKLNISRTPVREALFQLTADGLLEHTPRKGFRIKKLSQQDAKDIYQLIGLLDAKAAILSIPHLDENDFSNMQFLIDAMTSAIRNKLYTKYNELQDQFHDMYILKCQNKILIDSLEKHKNFFIGNKYCNIEPEEIQEMLLKTNKEHQKILELFKEKDSTNLRIFIENVHWSVENAQYDIW